MPRNGRLARIVLALGAAALLATVAAGAASAAHHGHKKHNKHKRHKVHLHHYGGSLVGAGSSLVGPALAIWAPMYKAQTVQYSSIGSGGGIAAISARTVDFGASDAPLTPDQASGCHGCIQIPWALTATVPVVNIPGVATGQLHLTGPVLARIYLGQITKWNDPAITKLNRNLNLPNTNITPVHRSDGSGDTYVFTNYLSKVSKKWRSQVGYATSVSWPTGIGGTHNDGVAAIIDSTPGTIGYVSVAYVLANHLRIAKLKNASGKYTLPTLRSIESAAQLVKAKKIPKNNAISITNAPKTKHRKYENAYPLATFTYVIVPKSTAKAAQLKQFIAWALTAKPQNAIKKLVFAPMPKVVVEAARKTLKKIHS